MLSWVAIFRFSFTLLYVWSFSNLVKAGYHCLCHPLFLFHGSAELPMMIGGLFDSTFDPHLKAAFLILKLMTVLKTHR